MKELVGNVFASSGGMAVKAVASPRRFSWIHVICERKCAAPFANKVKALALICSSVGNVTGNKQPGAVRAPT